MASAFRRSARHQLMKFLLMAFLASLPFHILGDARAEDSPAKFLSGGWQSGFQPPGFDGVVNALAIYQGDLYAAGGFSYVGATYTGPLARWDGSSWSGVAIPGATPETYMRLTALAVHDGYLVMAGDFYFLAHVGGYCRDVARTDGTSWFAMGAGFNSGVNALAVGPQGQLIAGGGFWYSGSTVVRNVAYWSGAQWLPFASGVNGSVYDVELYDGQIVIGGGFSNDNLGYAVSGIARWTESAWREIAPGAGATNNPVRSLEVHEGALYAGGSFGVIEGVAIQGLASWDGTSWSAVPWFPGAITVDMLRSTPSGLVASGTFNADNAPWDSIDDGISTRLNDAILYGTDWFVSGYFRRTDDTTVSHYLAVLESGHLVPQPGITDGGGFDDNVYAMTTHGGEVYASGNFLCAGGTVASRIAAWNGTQWRPLGAGLPAMAQVMGSYDDDLVVGGSFTTAGGLTVNRIALWDGLQWLALGSGLNGIPNALAQYGNDLVAAGSFTLAGGTSVANIARWDGSQWHALGSGLNGAAETMLVRDGLLIVGGDFTTAGGASASRLAAWDGVAWSEYAGGADNTVFALATFQGDLVAGGYFGNVGGVPASRVARLRAGLWEPMGSGFVGEFCYSDPGGYYCWDLAVNDMMAIGDKLYVSGSVNQAGAVAFSGLARWDDLNHWMAVDGGVSGGVNAMADLDGTLFVGGSFSTAGSTVSRNVAAWIEPTLSPAEIDRWWAGFDANGPVDGYVYSLGTYGDELVVAGRFARIDSVATQSIGTWDGAAWHSLAGGLANAGLNLPQVYATLEYGGDLYAAGMFSVPPSTATCDLARWDGSAWHELGLPGSLQNAHALAVFDGQLIVGGTFENMGEQPAARIAAWDGTSFSSLGAGLNGFVLSLCVHDGKLVAGGSFTSAGGVPVQNLAIWNGTAWEAPPPGFAVAGTVYCLLSHGTDLYVGSAYSTGSVPRIARWDGSAFHTLGTSVVGGTVRCLAWAEDRLVVGGNLQPSTDASMNYLATWDGASWLPLGGGVDDDALSAIVWEGELYVGGEFRTAGGKNSPHIGRWMSATAAPVALVPGARIQIETAYPNPFNPSINVRFSIAQSGPTSIVVHDVRGREIMTLADEALEAGNHTQAWNGRDAAGRSVAAGVYFVRVKSGGESAVRKILLLK